MNNKRNNRYKSRGSILVITALAAIVWIFIAQSLFIVGAGGFGMLKSSRVALQAQQYAEIEVDRLKNIAYENLDSDGAHLRQAIANIQESGWEDEVSIGSEHAISGSDDAKQRIATINVYRSGDTLPRFTLEVPLSSQGNNTPNPALFSDSGGYYKFSNGLIFQWGITAPYTADLFKKIYFPIPFPHKCLHISISTCTNRSISGAYGDATFTNDYTNQYFILNTDPQYGRGEEDPSHWFAIGY